MDKADLRVFEAVVRLGSMKRAAVELNTVQSNVTGRIGRLETELGTKLFERRSRGVIPTAAAHRLLPYAHQAARLFEEAYRAAVDDGTPKGPLVIGSLETTAALRLAPILGRFVAAYPDVDLVLRTGTTEEMIIAVLEDQLEGAFVCGPVDQPTLDSQAAFCEELVLVTAPGTRSVEAALGATSALHADVRIAVLRAGCSYRRRLENVLAERGVVDVRLLEFGSLDAIVACAGAGLGISLLPRGVVEPARQKGQVAIHQLAPSESLVDTLFIKRHDRRPSSALSAFVLAAKTDHLEMSAA